MYADTKADAKLPMRRLNFAVSQLQFEIAPYFFGKLSEVVSCAGRASGQPKDKADSESYAKQSWYVFKCGAVAAVGLPA